MLHIKGKILPGSVLLHPAVQDLVTLILAYISTSVINHKITLFFKTKASYSTKAAVPNPQLTESMLSIRPCDVVHTQKKICFRKIHVILG